jgi:hypothetical protein
MKNLRLIKPFWGALLALGLTLQQLPGAPDDAFKDLADFRAEAEFRELLASMPMQLESGGAKVLRKKDGSLWLVAVGLTDAREGGGTELIRRRSVAVAKAQAAAVATLHGEKVTAVSVLSDTTTTATKNGEETAVVEETLTESVITQSKGMIKGMPQIGSWMDKSRQLAFFAIGKQIK